MKSRHEKIGCPVFSGSGIASATVLLLLAAAPIRPDSGADAGGGPCDRRGEEPGHRKGPRIHRLGAGEVRRGAGGCLSAAHGLGLPGLGQDESQKIYSPIMTEQTERRSAQIGLTQPLFTWGQVSAAIRAAKVGLQSAEEQLRVYQQAAKRDVSAAFYDVLLARELHALALHNLEQKKRHLEEARRKLQAGVATDYDVLAAEVSVENARPETIRTENQIRTARERLRFLLAIENGEVDVTGSLEATLLPSRPTRRPSPWPARNGRTSPISATGSASTGSWSSWPARRTSRASISRGRTAGTTLEQPAVSGDGPSWSVGVQLSYPFFDGLRTKGRVAQAESDLRRIQIDEAKQIDAVALEVREAVNAVARQRRSSAPFPVNGEPGGAAPGDGGEGLRTGGQDPTGGRRRRTEPPAGEKQPEPRPPRLPRRPGQPRLGHGDPRGGQQ